MLKQLLNGVDLREISRLLSTVGDGGGVGFTPGVNAGILSLEKDRGRYRQAAAVYRGLVAGIDDNIELVDGAYDHYARVFREGLDAYVECVTAAALSSSEYESYEQFLVKRIESGSQIHREQFERALSSLQVTIEE